MAPDGSPDVPAVQPSLRGWITVLGGFLVHITLGTLYSFGNMSPYFTSYIREYSQPSDLRYSDSTWVFGVMLAGQGGAMFLGGFISTRLGARPTVLMGCLIQSIGTLLTGVAIKNSFVLSTLTYGVMVGFGTGIAYAPPMACAMKWLPQYKGLVNGIVVAGFGAGAFVFDQIQTAYINPGNLSPDKPIAPGSSEKYYSAENAGDLLDRVPKCYFLLGGCYVALQIIGVCLISDPTEKSSPSESDPLVEDANTSESNDVAKVEEMDPNTGIESNEVPHGMHPKQVLRSKHFYIIWLTFLVNGQIIIFISTMYKTYGQTFIEDDHFLGLVGSFASVGNSLGRIVWGLVVDRIPYKTCMVVLCGAMICWMCTLIATPYGGKPMFFIWIILIFLTFSGNFSLFPTVTARAFGPRYVAMNYGLVFTSQVVTGLFGSLLTISLNHLLGWTGLFFLGAGFSLIGLLLTAVFFDLKDADGRDI